jgi:two-component system NtrC family sensor kinase
MKGEMKRRAKKQDQSERTEEEWRKGQYAKLYRKFIGITLVCSLVPLLLVGWAINIHYTRFAKTRMTESFQTEVGCPRGSSSSF